MQYAFLPSLFGMMASFTAAQHTERPRRWLAAGIACFALCVAANLAADGGIGATAFKTMLKSVWEQ